MINYLFLSAILFIIGLCGVFIKRKNLIAVLLSIEIMLLAINTTFIALTAQIFVLFIIAVTTAEIALGLALLVLLYRERGKVNVDL